MKVVYTISTANHLFLAKTMGDSFLQHNPDYKYLIFLYDKIEDRFDVTYFFPIEIIEIESLHLPAFNVMVHRYSIFEMCNALKPFVAEFILFNYEVQTLIYADSDLLFYHSLTSIQDTLQKYNIIITPHSNSPIPFDEFGPDERAFLQGGIYNGGFFALRPSPETDTFLSWWKSRLEKFCFVNYAEGLFVDQKWMNFIPLYFDTVLVLKHPGYNIGHWNLHERFLNNVNGKYFVNGTHPLVFFHFSGYDIFNANNISKYQNRFTFAVRPDLANLFKSYTNVVLENKPTEFSKLQCYYTGIKLGAAVSPANKNKMLFKSKKGLLLKHKIKSKLKKLWNRN